MVVSVAAALRGSLVWFAAIGFWLSSKVGALWRYYFYGCYLFGCWLLVCCGVGEDAGWQGVEDVASTNPPLRLQRRLRVGLARRGRIRFGVKNPANACGARRSVLRQVLLHTVLFYTNSDQDRTGARFKLRQCKLQKILVGFDFSIG